MRLTNPSADLYVPDDLPMPGALSRTTHLCVGAHQDDQELMAFHGIAECFGRSDKWFTGVTITSGEGSVRAGEYADCTDGDMIEVRRLEQRKAALVGEYACQVQLMYPSSETKKPGNESVLADLRAVLEAAQPQIVYLHNPADRHDTHVASFFRALSALRALPLGQRPAKVYGCEVWRDLDWLHHPDRVVLSVDDHPNIAASLSGVFDSQISSGKRFDTAVAGRRMAHATFLESHATDKASAVSFAMDLTPLIADDSMTAADFILRLIRNFESDVKDRIASCS